MTLMELDLKAALDYARELEAERDQLQAKIKQLEAKVKEWAEESERYRIAKNDTFFLSERRRNLLRKIADSPFAAPDDEGFCAVRVKAAIWDQLQRDYGERAPLATVGLNSNWTGD